MSRLEYKVLWIKTNTNGCIFQGYKRVRNYEHLETKCTQILLKTELRILNLFIVYRIRGYQWQNANLKPLHTLEELLKKMWVTKHKYGDTREIPQSQNTTLPRQHAEGRRHWVCREQTGSNKICKTWQKNLPSVYRRIWLAELQN